mmetsp:Transcript_31721/g.73611  ORF Transcript_31721/g.73611 Transcript_31721/m.73611 type:complete len:522 (+) Transcript_31721:103-1668(+)
MGLSPWIVIAWLALVDCACPGNGRDCKALEQDEGDKAALGLLQMSQVKPPPPLTSLPVPPHWQQQLQDALPGLLNFPPLEGPPPVECDLENPTDQGCPLAAMERGRVYGVLTGGETICLSGEAYKFQVVKRDPDKLLYYFQGGGACWDFFSYNIPLSAPRFCLNGTHALSPKCQEGSTGLCTKTVSFSGLHGIFDGSNPNNPYKDHTIVLLPYCSGDIFAGNAVQHWAIPSRKQPTGKVKQHGFHNAQAVLKWVAPQFQRLKSLVLGGFSAGALGVAWWGGKLLETLQREGTRTVVIADSFMGASYPLASRFQIENFLFKTWNTCDTGVLDSEMQRRCNRGTLQLSDLWLSQMNANPLVSFTTINSKEDAVQIAFEVLLCRTAGFHDCASMTPAQYYYSVNGLLGKYFRHAVNYQAFLIDGVFHTYTELREFYTANPLSPFGNVTVPPITFFNMTVGPLGPHPASPKLVEWLGAVTCRRPLTCKYVCIGPSRSSSLGPVEGSPWLKYCDECVRNEHPVMWR